MLLPRVGWEVGVMYVDGNPDSPVVVGRLYNGRGIVPYAQPGHATTTTLQSATSPADGTTNEIRMGDSGGGQEMFIHASKDQTVTVGGSSTTKVGANEVHDVTLSYAVKVDGAHSHTVGAAQKVNVGTDYSLEVKGARTELVGGAEIFKVTANRFVNVDGAYIEAVGGAYGLQCNQENIEVKPFYMQLVGVSTGHVSGLGTSENVGGARVEAVTAGRTIVSATKFSDGTKGKKLVTCGPSSVKAGGKVTTESKKSSGSITAGTFDFTASGVANIEAEKIEIEAASLDAGAFELKGGALKIGKGTTKIDGTISRKGGESKIE